MTSLAFYGPEGFRLEEHKDPEPSAGQVLLKVLACGICGGDHAVYRRKNGFPVPAEGVILGHEVIGEVLSDPEGRLLPGSPVAVAPNWGCGECRFCRSGLPNLCERNRPRGFRVGGGFADRMVVARAQCRPLPSSPDYLDFTLTEPLACCLHACERADLGVGSRALILGAGASGLLFTQLARLRGASRIAVADSRKERIELALRLGADEGLDAEAPEAAESGLFDVVIITRSKPRYLELALRLCGFRARALVYGVMDPEAIAGVPPRSLWERQISIVGSRSYEGRDFDIALDLIASGRVKAGGLITMVVDLRGAARAFEGGEGQIKTIIAPEPR